MQLCNGLEDEKQQRKIRNGQQSRDLQKYEEMKQPEWLRNRSFVPPLSQSKSGFLSGSRSASKNQ